MGPLDASIAWSEEGLEGARKFLDRVYRLITLANLTTKNDGTLDKVYNETVKKVTDRLDGMLFNTAISQLMIFVNAANKVDSLPKAYAEGFVQLLAPFAPHLAEELWEKLGHLDISYVPWPNYDPTKLIEDKIEVVIQINGKLKAKMTVAKDLTKEELGEEAKKTVSLDGTIVKTISVPNKLVNFVVKK